MPITSATLTTAPTVSRDNEVTAKTSQLSVHLDAIRGIAALLVLVEHIRNLFYVDYAQIHHPNVLQKLGYFVCGLGHDAVVVFFVLSGLFVGSSVDRSVQQGRWSWVKYANQRLSRLYVVLLPALLLGGLLDHLGTHLFGHHGIYGGGGQYAAMADKPIYAHDGLSDALINACFLQGIVAPPFGSNGPLWSLSFEFWYYIAFPLLFLLCTARVQLAKRALYGALLAATVWLVGKTIAAYFLIWLAGWAVARLASKAKAIPNGRVALFASAAAFLVAIVWSRLGGAHHVELDDFVLGIAFSIFVFLLSVTLRGVNCHESYYSKLAKGVSGSSYSLYLLHTPVLFFLNAVLIGTGVRWQPNGVHGLYALGIAAVAFIYVWAIWRITEANTQAVRSAVDRLINRVATQESTR